MSADYRCPKCQSVYSAEDARAALYRCPACRANGSHPLAYLVAHRPPPGPVPTVRPSAVPGEREERDGRDDQADLDEPAPDLTGIGSESPGNDKLPLIDRLEAALAERRKENAREASAQAQRRNGKSQSDGVASLDSATNPAGLDDLASSQSGYVSDGGSARQNEGIESVLVLPPPTNEIDAAAMEQLAGTLARLPTPVALEIAGAHRQRQLMVRGAPDAVARIESQLYSIYDQVDVQPLPADKDPARAAQAQVMAAARLTLHGPEFLPLKTWREFEGNDPLRPLLGAFGAVQEGEYLLSQLVIHGEAPEGWASPHLRQLAALKRRGYGADAPMQARNILGWTAGVALVFIAGILLLSALVAQDWRAWVAAPVGIGLAALAIALLRLSENRWAEALDDDAAAKLREKAFQCELRLFASAASEARARRLLEQLIAAFQAFDTTSGNRIQPASLQQAVQPCDLAPDRAACMLLNVKELAGFWHMPVGPSLELVRRATHERLLPLPEDVTNPGGAFIGVSRKGRHAIPVQLSHEALRGNMILVGKTQHGKSTLMAHIAARWMRDPDRSVVVVDPHGDLARQVIGLFPPERLGDVIYLDLPDETRSAGLNLIDVSDGSQPHEAAETFMDIGKALWKDNWGPRMAIPLQFGLRALACANQRRPPDRQYTILSLVPLLTCDPEVREAFLRREVPLEDQPGLHQYFLCQYNFETQMMREQVISPVLSKAHAFERSPAILRLVGQPRSTLRLFEAIRSRKILIVNTNAGVLSEDLSGFAGSLILNIMRRVIAQQTTLPRVERVRVSVIADEFQTMTGADFGALLGELQKNGGNFVLGTQSLDSLKNIDVTGALTGKIFAGVTTRVAFQVNGADAHYLVQHELDCERLKPESLMNLPKYSAYLKTVDEVGRPIPVCSIELAAAPDPDPRLTAAVRARQPAYTVPADEAERLAQVSLLRFSDEYRLLNPKGEPVPHGRPDEAERAANGIEKKPVSERDAPPEEFARQQPAVESETQREQKARVKAPLPEWAMGSRPPREQPSEQATFGASVQEVMAPQARKQDGTPA